MEKENVELRFARIKTHVMEIMRRGGLLEAVPLEHFYLSVQDGVNAILVDM